MQKILLEIKGIEQPLELWWTDDYLNQFRKNEKEVMGLKPFRIPNTPSSILEVNLDFFEGLFETGEYDIIPSELSFKRTALYKYFVEFGIPVPKSTFNEEFKFPSTLIVIRDHHSERILKLDFSNYTNLDYLSYQGKSLTDHLNTRKEYLHEVFSDSRFIYAEYSKMGVH
jgi:hypothetical protein